MKRLLSLLLIFALVTPAYAANQWGQGSNTNPLVGTIDVNDVDTNFNNYVYEPLDRLTKNYRTGMRLKYNTAAQLTVTAGELTVSDSADSIHLMLSNSADTTVTWADIDTGVEASGTTYYLYGVGATTSATAVTFKISTSSSAPSGSTYYVRLGSFTNDGSSNITVIANDDERMNIATGTVANAATISVPSGWSADECSWTVGVGTPTGSSGTSDAIRDMKQTASVTSGRVATCKRTRIYGATSEDISNTCTYLIACYR